MAPSYYASTCLIDGLNSTTWKSCCNGRTPTSACPSSVQYQAFCCTNTLYSPIDIANMGGISLLLTIINIICIYIFGMLTFRLKEVAPLKAKSALWQKLVPKTREFNKAYNRGQVDLQQLRKQIHQQKFQKQKNTSRSRQVYYPAQHAGNLLRSDSVPSLAMLFYEDEDDDNDNEKDPLIYT
jgi:hypothetical protein